MLVFPYVSRAKRHAAYVRMAASIRLFVNDVRPGPQTAASDFVEPPASIGYTPIACVPAQWRIEPIGVNVRAISAPARWIFTGGDADIMGHFTLDADGALLWSERFTNDQGHDEPFQVRRARDELQVVAMIDAEV